jgi:hypothetical protein
MGEVRPRTRVYVDGLNFYYRAMRHGRFGAFRWLDVVRFCDALLRRNRVELVRYFTADIRSDLWNRGRYDRQQLYLRAIASDPRLVIHKGHFVHRTIVRPLAVHAPNPTDRPRFVRVWNDEEKGSDVNLASYLLRDGFMEEYEVAVVVSDDSDLVEPIRIVRRDLGLPVGVVQLRERSAFVSEGDFRIRPRRWHFERSHLPLEVECADGRVVSRPREW